MLRRCGREPVADDCGADHVGDEPVFVAVPGEQDRAGAAAAIGFLHGDDRGVGQIDFVLENAGGPEDAEQVDVIGLRRGR